MSSAPLLHSRDIDATPHWSSLLTLLEQQDSLFVAFSGGVDSALLLKAAHDVLAERVVAVTAVSPSLASTERDKARQLAEQIGVAHREVITREGEDPLYAQNPRDRCFHCKRHLFLGLEELRESLGQERTAFAYGATVDDLGDYRPGMDAAREAGALAPLLDAGMGKAEVREASLRLGLPTWNKPALACLASRLPQGTAVTPARLAQVEAAEDALGELGFAQLRVRHHGELARVEVALEDLPRAIALSASITSALQNAGYAHVEIDPRGYRAGSLVQAPSGS